MPTLERFGPDIPARTVNEAIARDGGAILENALSPADRAQLDRESAALLAETPASRGLFHGLKTKRVGAMVAKSQICQRMALHPTVLAVMDRFLKPHCSAYQLNLSQLIAIGPGEQRQITHADDPMFPFVNRNYQAMINVIWAIDDFTADNGATHIAPESHGWPRNRVAKDDEIIQGVMSSGSCLIYLGSTHHGGGANRTDRPRRGLVISYCLGWLRQSENQYLAIPPEVARTFPEPLQRLIGYFVHQPNLGMVEGQDPIQLLNGNDAAWKAGFQDFMSDFARRGLEFYYEGKDAFGRPRQ
jgi:ectoine hydroxylase-related dioxygenase (phytanoyl-CoA dioxygenase family)